MKPTCQESVSSVNSFLQNVLVCACLQKLNRFHKGRGGWLSPVQHRAGTAKQLRESPSKGFMHVSILPQRTLLNYMLATYHSHDFLNRFCFRKQQQLERDWSRKEVHKVYCCVKGALQEWVSLQKQRDCQQGQSLGGKEDRIIYAEVTRREPSKPKWLLQHFYRKNATAHLTWPVCSGGDQQWNVFSQYPTALWCLRGQHWDQWIPLMCVHTLYLPRKGCLPPLISMSSSRSSMHLTARPVLLKNTGF